MLDSIDSVIWKYLNTFNCVQINDDVELIVLHVNTYNPLTVCNQKEMLNWNFVLTYQYLKPIDLLQTYDDV